MNKENRDSWRQQQPERLQQLLAGEDTPDKFWQKLDENMKCLIHGLFIRNRNGKI